MADNLGKKFELKFKEDFAKIPNSSIDRIYDVTSGYYGLRNICDFIGYCYPRIYYLECKSILGNTFPLSNLKQYDKLRGKTGIKGVIVGVIIWFRDHDKVVFVPINTITQLKEEGKKSVHVNMIKDNKYKIIDIPSVKKRTFLDSDYTVLIDMEE